MRTVGAHNLEPVDVICGGFPCQDLSYAGKGAGLAGERSGLWYEYLRIVRELRPRLVIVENVAALRSRGLGVVLGDLAALGYDSVWTSIRAADVGAPHRRERLFIVAHAHGLRQSQPGGLESQERGRSGDGDKLAHAHESRLEGRGLSERERGGERIARESSAGASAEGFAESRLGGSVDGLPAWLDRWPAGRNESQHSWEPPRVTTKAHQRRQRLKALGNAVVPQVAYCVGLLAKELLQSG